MLQKKLVATGCIVVTCGSVSTALADTSDPACLPTSSVVGWSLPKNVAIQDPNAFRLPIDATMRIGFSGPWCPDPDTIHLVAKKTMEPVPTQIRVVTPQTLFHNEPTPLSIIEVDPLPELDRSTDYILSIQPTMPALQIYANYEIQFRSGRRPMEPWPDFEGIKEVVPARDAAECWGEKIYGFSDEEMMRAQPCMREHRLELKVVYQPLDRPEATYAIYRTRSIPLDEGGLPKPDDPTYDDQLTLVGYEPGVTDVGSGVREKSSPYNVPYHVLPRRECFAVLLVDEWGREIGDVANDKCIDIPLLEPCPLPNGMMQNYPEPNPFEVRTPVDNLECDSLCLGDGDCESHIPPERPEPGTGGMSGEGGASGGGSGTGGNGGGGGAGGGAGGGTGDAGVDTDCDGADCAPAADGGGGGGGGCQSVTGRPAHGLFPLFAGLLGLALVRRRARR